ncbi:unnamed protein product [Rotaria magnacalcarata]|uniref:F-box domain-containing protein n=1 Tax=Rotaria magnacalcarata TaxID=392030 RepID=A0A814MUR1_9BILA|nr:unnamed protein product [Rotaria magnacalcarata]CAF1679385.1 unnamed protein product [Rotaria magnacalcarata]
MNHSTVNILTLCDEILVAIFNKLNNIDVLHSLIGVNRELDRLARDITFTQSLDLVAISSNKDNDSRNNSILDRFCFDILPRIQHNIDCLTLDLLLMDRILRIGHYSKLYKINLVIFQLEMASRILNVKNMFLFSPISLIDLPSTTCYSSNIVYLNVSLRNFDDCVCLLDERLS